MWDFSFFRACGLVIRTLPFILLRVIIYFGMAIAYVFFIGVGAGVGYGIGGFGTPEFRDGATFIGGFVGFGVTARIIYLLREYILYVVKAGHIAVLVQLVDGKPLPAGQSQFAYASDIVKARFSETSVLFLIDQLVKGVIGAITAFIRGITSFIPGMNGLANFLHSVLKVAAGFMDEVILAYLIRTNSQNAWESAREGLVLYGQNYKTILKNAVFLVIFIYVLALIIFLAILGPVAGFVYAVQPASNWSAGGFVAALIFAWAIKASLLEPIAITCMIQVYFKTIEGQKPDPEWDARLSEISAKFREIKNKALGAAGRAAKI